MFCTRCGHQNPDDARFCARCGTALSAANQPGPDAGEPAAASATSVLHAVTETTPGHAPDEPAGAEPADETQHVVDSLPPGSALLVVKRGPNAGSRFLLDKLITTAGRHPESDIFLDDVTVSRRHAEFVQDAAGFTVRDVGSLNGTYLDRDRIDEAHLSAGDEVQIGKFRLVFLAGPAREAAR